MIPTIRTPPAISGTAQNMAAFRALESAKPEGARLFCDPYAKRFLPPVQRILAECSHAPFVRRLVEHQADRLAPGARTSGIARTRLIDDWLREDVARGARQLVVLGAGFDCRALRLAELADIAVFEVDRPAMIALKNELLERESAQHGNVRRVAVDFLKDSLAERLSKSGYSPSLNTVFLWEGVTNYLDENSVAGVFDFVANNSASGSRIIFTYVHSDAVAGNFDAPGLTALLDALRRRGEPWTFGFKPEALPAYLAKHGLVRIADLGAAEYRRLYWKTMPDRPSGYEFYRTAHAETVSHAAR